MVGFWVWRYKIIGDLSFNDKTLAKMQKHLSRFGSITQLQKWDFNSYL